MTPDRLPPDRPTGKPPKPPAALRLARLPALLGLALLAIPSVGYADAPPPQQPSPREQAISGLDQLMQGLRRMIEQVPLYGPPELAPNGDIILRRIYPLAPPAAPAPQTP